MKKLLAAALTLSLAMTMLTACGNGGKEAAEDQASQNQEVQAEQETEQEASGTEEGEGTQAAPKTEEEAVQEQETGTSEALSDGVLNVGTNAEFPPFEYVDDNGEPDGFDMALVKAIGEKLGVEVTVENMEFDSLVASIGNKIDIAAAGMTVTPERSQTVDFSDTYYEAVQFVILPADSEIAQASDLEGKTIGVQLGTTGDFTAEELTENVSRYNKAVDAVNDLINGRVDCVIVDKNPALVFESRFEGKVVAVDGAQFGFEPEEYAIAIPKGDTALADQINTALEEIKADGTFDELVKTYIEAE
ncbi:MAG: transporter substrate-binding domain-containing protein [Lachnospiraceae bacterium]|jgi:ABC-type amino acid transport/signal transduction systems, periplasmic component/domain|nr:transporter substrate-binding domain-containing protein [Lachnospiraceae bacterium]